MNKNDVLIVDIIDNGINFEGIAKVNNFTVFVPYGIIGEKLEIIIIKVTKSFAIGKILNVIKSSKYREEAICPIYKMCGSCETAHINYDYELSVKKQNVINTFKKQGINVDSNIQIYGMGMPHYYRNKVAYPVRNINGINKIGFFRSNSHDIVENNCCYIQNRVIDMLAKVILDKLNDLKFVGYNEKDCTGDIRHIILRRGYHTSEILLVIVVNNTSLINDARFLELANIDKNIKSININLNNSKTNEILGNKTVNIYGKEYITDVIGDKFYYISAKSFFQVNTLQAEMLYSKLKEGLELNKDDMLFDLYSGVGSIGIFLSDDVSKVYGIEIEKDAVDMANLNIKRNDVKNAEYIAGSVEDKIVEFKNRNISPSVIVVDPPRRGLDSKSIEYILDFNPEKIGYVSCNYATLARDIKLLSDKYEVSSITLVDLFPRTHHVEVICILKRV